MKILVLNPPYFQPIIREGRCQSPQNMRKTSIPQMTMAYLATVLGKNGDSLRVHDCIALGMNEDDLFRDMDLFEPQLALINTTTPSINADLAFVKTFKQRYQNCFTAVIGTHVTALYEQILENNPWVDCVIRHEPEWSAVELSNMLKSGNAVAAVPGTALRVNGRIVAPDREFNPDLDVLGFPAWEHFPLDQYIHPVFNKPYLTLNTSRGCMHNCIFCVGNIFYGKKVRFRSIPSIIDELENHIIAKYGIHHVWFYADDFTRSPEFVKDLCRAIIQRRIKITWWTNTRVDKPDEGMFRLMKQAGCYMLSIGGESGNAQILKNIKKGTKPENIQNTVALLRKAGINSLVYFLIGLPGETRETIQETVDFTKRLNPDYVEFYPATPYPGTEFYDIARKQHLIIDESWDHYMCGGDQFVIEIPGVRKNELDLILRRAFREFYFRPTYAWLLFKRLLHPAEFTRLMLFGAGYFRRFISHEA